MNARSLKLRLLLIGAITISAALLSAGLGIVELFERHVERRAEAELDTYIRQISAGITFDAKGEAIFSHALADPRIRDAAQRTLLADQRGRRGPDAALAVSVGYGLEASRR